MTPTSPMLVPAGSKPLEPIPEREIGPRAVGMSLRSNFLWAIVGNVAYAACQWGMLVVLAKMGSAEMVGQFALALAISTPILMFTNLQLRGVQATDARGDYSFRDYLGLRLLMAAIGLGVIFV